MNASLITEQDLMEWTRFTRRGDLERWLQRQGIRYRKAKGGAICVTKSDLEQRAENDEIEFE